MSTANQIKPSIKPAIETGTEEMIIFLFLYKNCLSWMGCCVGLGKSRLYYPHSHQSSFAVVFPKMHQQSRFKKDHRKVNENVYGAWKPYQTG